MIRNLLSRYEDNINEYLTELYDEAPVKEISEESPLIIFSDLHMGNGKNSDDFRKNEKLFSTALSEYYLDKNFTLVLNGDIEELQKFRMITVQKQWKKVYAIFDNFAEKDRLVKITGNHDDDIRTGVSAGNYNEKQAVRFNIKGIETPVFIFHGHQASIYYRHLNKLNTILLRYIVNPLGVKNFSKKFHHEKKMRIENRSYNYSRMMRIISIIGHTHRPLFESLSRADSLHFSIENLLRRYRKADNKKREIISARIKDLKQKYDRCIEAKSEYEPASLMYSRGIPVPCLFNTGCAIGKRGITGIEITTKKISLVHWFDSRISSRFLFDSELEPEPVSENLPIYRVVLRTDKLEYISDTINILGGTGKSETSIKNISDFSSKQDFFGKTKQNLTIPC